MEGQFLQQRKSSITVKSKSAIREKIDNLKQFPSIYKSSFPTGIISKTLTFNDVLLVPQYSQVSSRSQCQIKSLFSHNIPLNVPIVSSPMDTVTQTQMAVEMARQGGLGIIHRFMTIEQQVEMIEKVKRSGVFINPSPVTIGDEQNYSAVKLMLQKYGISSFLVTKSSEKKSQNSPRQKGSPKVLHGILTQRDIKMFNSNSEKVKEYMTPLEKLIVYEVNSEFDIQNCDLNSLMEKCKKLLISNKIQKIPIVNSKREILGLVSLKDLSNFQNLKTANKDHSGRLFVGASVGANKDYIERAKKLYQAGCDVLVVDVANGHSKLAMDATQELKQMFPNLDIVSGSVATGEGAENLIRSGADGIRCGIGNGSICITRIVAGSGVPQLSALIDTAPVCSYYDVPLCSDGGNKNSGNMCKALAVGADSIMVGRLIAGCEESPGIPFNKDGRFVKMYRGMAGLGANLAKEQKMGSNKLNPQTFSAEGVEGYIPFAGPLEYHLNNFANGIRSGMSYSGAFNLKELRKKAKLTQISNSGFAQSNVHGISKFD